MKDIEVLVIVAGLGLVGFLIYKNYASAPAAASRLRQ